MWERQTFVCWYQSPFGPGNAEHVRLLQNLRQQRGINGPSVLVLVQDRTKGPRVLEDFLQNPPVADHFSLGCIS